MAEVCFVVVCCILSFVCHLIQAQAPLLTSMTFEDKIIGSPHFVMFYGPWCEHCKAMMSTWDNLSKEYVKLNKQINIAKVDCTAETPLCARHNIKAYPTLKLYYEKGIKRYDGKRSVAEFMKFVNQLVFKEKTKQDSVNTVNNVKILTKQNFDEQTAIGLHFVKFYAPWCIHCIKLAPIWESLAAKYKDSPAISIAKIDCTTEGTKCSQYNVNAFPTLKLFKDGKEIEQYSGGRALKDLDTFVAALLPDHSLAPPADTSQSDKHDNEKSIEEPLPPPSEENDDDLVNILHGVFAFSRPKDSKIIPYQLTENNFDHMVSFGTTFIMFYAPWCVHCKNLAPIWKQLTKKCAETAAGPKIAKIDCTVEEKLCQTFGVNGYPTLTLFKDGHPKQEYNGNRDLESLYRFVMQHHDKDEL